MSDLDLRTRAFFDAWAVSFDALTTAFSEVLAADCVWEQRPVVTRSRADALTFLRRPYRRTT